MPGPVPIDPAIRYHAKIDKRGEDECWEWTAARFDRGYGAFRLGSKQLKAHRFGYELVNGPIPSGMYVCHACDNPPCQNPKHWFLGTHRVNAADREAKGRGNHGTGPLTRPHPRPPRARGERGGNAKLTDADVRRIRRLYRDGLSQQAIADQSGVTQRNVSNIVRGVTWSHITDD